MFNKLAMINTILMNRWLLFPREKGFWQ